MPHPPRALPDVLAGAARDSGHQVDTTVTVAGLDRPADVLALSPGHRRTVLQAAPSTADSETICAQTARALQSGLDIVWFTSAAHDPPWLPHVPAVRVTPPERPGNHWSAQGAVQRLTTETCTCGPAWGHGVHRVWAPPEQTPLAPLLDALLSGCLIHATVQPDLPGRRYTAWASSQDVRTEADHMRTLAAAAHASPPDTPRSKGRPAVSLGRLLEAACRWGHHKTGAACHVETASADWMAGGFLLTPSYRPPGTTRPPAAVALVRPLPHQVDWTGELSTVPVLVGSPEEYLTLQRTAPVAAQILIL